MTTGGVIETLYPGKKMEEKKKIKQKTFASDFAHPKLFVLPENTVRKFSLAMTTLN